VKSARFMQRAPSGTNARWQAVGAALRP
jgi:hypothetical protein